jgi:hypothetical protein
MPISQISSPFFIVHSPLYIVPVTIFVLISQLYNHAERRFYCNNFIARVLYDFRLFCLEDYLLSLYKYFYIMTRTYQVRNRILRRKLKMKMLLICILSKEFSINLTCSEGLSTSHSPQNNISFLFVCFVLMAGSAPSRWLLTLPLPPYPRMPIGCEGPWFLRGAQIWLFTDM